MNDQYEKGVVRLATLHSAITASVAIGSAKAEVISGAKAVAIQLVEGGTVLNRSGKLEVYGTVDGTNYALLGMLIDNTSNSNSENLTRVDSKTRDTAGSDLLFLDKAVVGALRAIKAVMTITDGATPTGNFTVTVATKY